MNGRNQGSGGGFRGLGLAPGMPQNPFLQVVYFLVGGLLVIGAVLMGAVILAFVLGLVLIFGIVFWIRLWWLRRKLRRAGFGEQPGPGAQTGKTIEVEYTVVEERESRDSKD
jgi:hypothetical protein